MLNSRITSDQAAGLRQLMMPASEKLVTVALATPDLKIEKSIRLLRTHLDKTQYDTFVEFKPLHYSNIKTKLPPLGKVIICLVDQRGLQSDQTFLRAYFWTSDRRICDSFMCIAGQDYFL